MGIFDWFKSERSNVEVVSDRIWLTKPAKLAGISKEVSNSLTGSEAPDAIFLVAHFQDCLNELQALAQDILHSRADETVPFEDSRELLRSSGLPESALIVVGTEHRLADPESLAAMVKTCERKCPRIG